MFAVAKLAGVSHQTVSRVINHSPEVSDRTRGKVLAAIASLGYRPSNSARSLASRRSRTIGLIAGGLRFFGPMSTIASIESTARSHGLFLSVSMVHEALCSQDEFDALCGTFGEQDVDAYVVLAPTDAMFHAVRASRIDRACVVVASTHGGAGEESFASVGGGHGSVATVGVDQWNAMRQVVHLLAGFGHRSALYFAGPQEWRDAATRLRAWLAESAAAAIDSTVVRCSTWQADEAYGRMGRLIDDCMADGMPLPTVAVAANDAQAVGVIRALRERGLRIPQDVGVVGFDDMPGMDNLFPPLTTVRPDFAGLGMAAMREALRMLGEEGESDFEVIAHGVGLVPATLIDRESVGPAGGV